MKNTNSTPSLYALDESIRAVLECADLDGTDESIDINKLLDELEMQREVKLENVLLYIKSRIALGKAIREEEKNLAERRKAIEAQVESLKSYVANSILSHGDKKFETAKVKATFRSSTATVCLLSDKPTEKDCARPSSCVRKSRGSQTKRQLRPLWRMAKKSLDGRWRSARTSRLSDVTSLKRQKDSHCGVFLFLGALN